MDVDPRFTPDGRYLLWSSDRTGIYDVYALRARHRAALSGDQRAVRRVPARGLHRRQPAGLRRLQPRRASTSTRCRSIPTAFSRSRSRSELAPRRCRRRRRDDDSPDAGRRRGPNPPVITSERLSYKPWKYMYPRTWELRFYSEALGLGDAAFISTTIADPVGNHSVGANLLLPLDGDPSAGGWLRVPAAVPVVRHRLPSHRPALARPDHRRRRHALPAASSLNGSAATR